MKANANMSSNETGTIKENMEKIQGEMKHAHRAVTGIQNDMKAQKGIVEFI